MRTRQLCGITLCTLCSSSPPALLRIVVSPVHVPSHDSATANRAVLTTLGESTLAQRAGAPGSGDKHKTWRTQVSKTKKKEKRANTFVASVPLWTVRCGQRRKLSRLRKQSARRNQSISSKQNKRKNAADEPPFISQRATALERLGKSANSQTGFYDFRNMVGGKLRFLAIRNVLVSCNTTVTKVCLDGRGICESTASENDGGVVWKHFLHPRNETPGVFFKWFCFNKSRRKTLTRHHRDTEILQCTEMRHNLYVWTKCGRPCAHIQVFSLSLPIA